MLLLTDFGVLWIQSHEPSLLRFPYCCSDLSTMYLLCIISRIREFVILQSYSFAYTFQLQRFHVHSGSYDLPHLLISLAPLLYKILSVEVEEGADRA